MKRSALLLCVFGCPAPEAGDDTAELVETGEVLVDDTSAVVDDVVDCEDGPGTVRGYLLGSDSEVLYGGEVRLWDSSGSTQLSTASVSEVDGTYSLTYGSGDYGVQGVYGACVGTEVSLSLCGGDNQVLDLSLTCAP